MLFLVWEQNLVQKQIQWFFSVSTTLQQKFQQRRKIEKKSIFFVLRVSALRQRLSCLRSRKVEIIDQFILIFHFHKHIDVAIYILN